MPEEAVKAAGKPETPCAVMRRQPAESEDEGGQVEEMVILDRESILAADDLPCQPIKVPEWGGWVMVKIMTGRERDSFEGWFTGLPERQRHNNFRAQFAARVICDESGRLLFGIDEVEKLGAKSGKVLSRVVDFASEVNGLMADDIKELEGN